MAGELPEPAKKVENERRTESILEMLAGGGLASRSPGVFLILVAGGGLYFVVSFGNFKSAEPLVQYLAIAFCGVLALAGIVLMFVQVNRDAASASETVSVTSSDLEHAVSQLGKNYDILRRQATQGFLLAGTMMALGVCVTLAGSVGQLFGLTEQKSNLTLVAGVVVEVVS